VVKPVDPSTCAGNFFRNGVVRLRKKRFRHDAIGHTGLACDDHYLEAAAVQQPYRIDGIWKQLQPIESVEITDVLDHRAITIDEDGAMVCGHDWSCCFTDSNTRSGEIR